MEFNSIFVWDPSEEESGSHDLNTDSEKKSFGFYCGCQDKFNQRCGFVCASEKLIKQHYARKHNILDVATAPPYEYKPMLKDKRKYVRSNIESGSELGKRIKTSVEMCSRVGRDLKNVKDSSQLASICENIKELYNFIKECDSIHHNSY